MIVIGSLLQWATVNTGFGSISAHGTDGDGVLTLASGMAVLVLVALQTYVPAVVVSGSTGWCSATTW
jgi:hypothetical protein